MIISDLFEEYYTNIKSFNLKCSLFAQDLDEEELKELTEGAIAMSEDLEFKDDGYIELVLRVLGLMCDNQNKGLQVSLLTYCRSVSLW